METIIDQLFGDQRHLGAGEFKFGEAVVVGGVDQLGFPEGGDDHVTVCQLRIVVYRQVGVEGQVCHGVPEVEGVGLHLGFICVIEC